MNLKENQKGNLVLWVIEDVSGGLIRLSARAVCQQRHREGYYSRAAEQQPFIIKTNALLGVQWSGKKTHKKKSTTLQALFTDMEKGNMVRQVIFHHVFSRWSSACVAKSKFNANQC